jgi:imidazolonepropionase-like amidohydrolase
MEFRGTPVPYAPPGDDTVTVFRGAIVGGQPATSIVVRGQRIAAIVPDQSGPADADHVDLDGRFVIAGLIDTHQHIATPPDRADAEAVLARQISGGVTAVRDMADDLRQIADLARATLVGEIPGPDIRYAALMAGPAFFDDPRTWQVSQGAIPGEVPWMQAITPDTDLRLAVARAQGTGATAIKIYADLPAAMVAAITAEAHRQQLQVWAHATVFPAAPMDMVAAGVDVLSHVSLLPFQGEDLSQASYKNKPPIDYARFAGEDDPVMAALFAEMRARGTILDATASMWTRYPADDEHGKNEHGKNEHGKNEHGTNEHGTNDERRKNMAALSIHLTRQAHRAGVEITTGTDYELPADQAWPSLIEEMLFFNRECGIPAADVILAATRTAAASAGVLDDMGTLAPGKLANFVVVDGDPEADLTRLRSPHCTVKRGHPHFAKEPA